MSGVSVARRSVRWLPQWWVGLLLVAVCWPLDWTLPQSSLRTSYLFFPLWLGYILLVDALVQSRTGSSPWARSRTGFAMLFVASAPVWWLFELINQRTQNWEYLGGDRFSPLEYFLLCTLCFSTVMPAVFETAELLRSFHWMQRLARGRRWVPTPARRRGLFLAGTLALALTLAWPRYFYPLVWASLVLLLEPVNAWLGRPHLLQGLGRGDWRLVTSLALGALVCGFFWEMWNYYSFPKWVYHTPGAQFLHVFEMPLLGYGGYIPFGLELYELQCLLWPRGAHAEANCQ